MKNAHRLALHTRPERYRIMLRPDLEAFTFYGEETIYLTLDKPSKQITLHSIDLEIDSAEFIHGNKETWAGKISYDTKAETATFTFPKAIQTGKGELKLIFRGILNDKMRGFYRSQYEVLGESKFLATTQFESTDARRAFPCFDEPSQKAIFDVTLMVPAHLTAISNTIESSLKEHESGLKVVEFAPTPKMSTYLLAFIVGDFEYIEGFCGKTLVRVFTTPGKKHQAKFALDTAIKCLKFYNNYFDIPYPLPVLDLIAIPDFSAGAMENWGAVTYRESTLLVDEERTSTGNKQWVALVIAHELAHQWFGNLVTMEWWTHLWLSEGFASFIEYLAIDHIFPEWDIWTQFVAMETGEALSLDSLKNTHPIEVKVGHPSEISEIFDKVSYSKGASVLRMLWKYLGEKNFQKGLQHYLKKHSYANATTEDLWEALEEVSGKPVNKLMTDWISKPGHPLIRVQEIGDSGQLKLTQTRFYSSPISKKESKNRTVWDIPIRLQVFDSEVAQARGATGYSEQLLMDKKVINIDKPKDDGWIKLNSNEASFFRTDYPHKYLKKLEAAIKNNKLAAQDRLGLIRDTFGLAQSGDSPTTLALELVLSYVNEEDYTVWAEITGYISQVDSLLAFESFYPNFKSYGRAVYREIANKIGWEKRKAEKHTDGLLRGLVINKLGSFEDKPTIEKAYQLFKTGKIDPDLRGVVYNLVAENGYLKEFDALIKMYKEEDNQQEKERIGRSLGKFKNQTLLKKTLEFAISKTVRFQNSLQIIASVWGNPGGRYLAWEFVKKNWQMLKERYAGGHYFTRVLQPAGEFTRKADAKDIEEFIAKNPAPEARRTIAQVLEQIYSNAEWLARDRKNMVNFLKDYA